MVNALYGPIFANIDAEEVGSRSRAMRIGEDYGNRLALQARNVKDRSIERLARTYPSHGFVIDYLEAQTLFERVRVANEIEVALVTGLGKRARFPMDRPQFTILKPEDFTKQESPDGERRVQNGEDNEPRRDQTPGASGGNGAAVGATG
jgi:hypothetical protein